MDRPALRRLIDHVKERKNDAVVVYKVDRLISSLADFAKIVEIFDAHQVSLVSVTQQFNTTTSMGRLTLRVLLSFAQFEREVTGERIRDKTAASKRKGMWMGGNVPLGYDAKDRKLLLNAKVVEAVREIYRQYMKLGCVSRLKTYLERNGITSKERLSPTGRKTGGIVYSRGALSKILRNRIYLGEIEHRGQVYPGEHEAIVSRTLWQRVQAHLHANDHAHKNRSRSAIPSSLVALIYDERGNRFTPPHVDKNGKRYRYYVSQATIKNPGSSHRGLALIPAGEIERLVCSRLQYFLESPHEIVDALSLERNNVAPTQGALAAAQQWSEQVTSAAGAETRPFIRSLISRIVIHSAIVDILLDKQALRSALLESGNSPPSTKPDRCNGQLTLRVKARLKRCGGEVRLVLPGNSHAGIPARPLPSLIKAVVRAHVWYERIVRDQLNGSRTIARETGLDERYVSRILQCAFLAPDIVESIINGRQPVDMTLERLRIRVPINWAAQRQLLGFPER